MSRLNDLLGPIFANIKADLEQIFSKIGDLRNAVNYPEDSEGEKILPVGEKMLTVKSDGSTDYEDLPEGDVKKSLLLNLFSEDDSKTKVNITINTSGTPVTGEVRGLIQYMQLAVGDGTTGGVNRHSNGYLWYVALGRTLVLPVTPGHTYKFVPESPKAEDGWYATNGVYFSPGYDATFNKSLVKIPGTDGAIAFDATEHSDDGVGKLFYSSKLVVPEGMHYVVFSGDNVTRDSEQPDGIRLFNVYDYTEWPVDAPYEKIVEDPVIGDTYNISYALTRATASNSARSIGGSAQYKTVIRADAGKVITSCSVKVGNQIYNAYKGELTISGTASNFKIMAVAEALPEDTYVGVYEVKPELIPQSLLEGKLDSPPGFDRAEEGQMIYADGSGGVVVKDAPIVPNSKISMAWKNVYGYWAAGYYYNPTDNYAYTQMDASETNWGNVLRTGISSTPFDNLIPVAAGERYRYLHSPIMLDRINKFLPGVLLFDKNKELVQVFEITLEESHQGTVFNVEFTIPNNAVWMALTYKNSHKFTFQKYDVKTFDEFDLLNAVHANYRAYLLGNPPVMRPLDKAYFCFGSDDLRIGQTDKIHEMFTTPGFPYYMASIPQNIKACVVGSPYHTNYDYMQMCVQNGGEIICHSDEWIREDNIDDFDTLYNYFCENKRELEFYGFDVHGLCLAGGSGGINHPDERMDAWVTYFFDYSDQLSYTFPYRFQNRIFLEYYGVDSAENKVRQAIANKSYEVFATHEANDNCKQCVTRIASVLSEYTEGVDYEIITPYELYKKLMPVPSSS